MPGKIPSLRALSLRQYLLSIDWSTLREEDRDEYLKGLSSFCEEHFQLLTVEERQHIIQVMVKCVCRYKGKESNFFEIFYDDLSGGNSKKDVSDCIKEMINRGLKVDFNGQCHIFEFALAHGFMGRYFLGRYFLMKNLGNLSEGFINQSFCFGEEKGLNVLLYFLSQEDNFSTLLLNRLKGLMKTNMPIIAPEILNYCIPVEEGGAYTGQSVAFWLAATVEGRKILALNEARLAKLISENTLNHVITQGQPIGESVAFWLAATVEGQNILALHEGTLAKLISEDTLNHVIRQGQFAGASIAFALAATGEGQNILALHERGLAKLISEDTN